MAEHRANPLQLQWVRQNGAFVINVVAVVPGQDIALIVRSWVLSKEEEISLRQALSGLIIAGNHK